MKNQTLTTHVRQHPLYHYFIVPLSIAIFGVAGIQLVRSFSIDHLVMFVATLLLHVIAFIARDYAKKNQDRIIRAELRLRYHRLTGLNLEDIEHSLTKDQLVALRFSDDNQLVEFLRSPRLNHLSPTDIKKQIKNWKPDLMRV